LKINLKINQKERKEIKDHIESRLETKLNLKGPNKDKFLPDIRNNSKGMRYNLNLRHQKYQFFELGPASSVSSDRQSSSSEGPKYPYTTDLYPHFVYPIFSYSVIQSKCK